jgi:L-histidine N-alpha-methyltransferase
MDDNAGISFMKSMADRMKHDDAFLVGFDMVKPRADMEAAYNDSAGVTARFNKNILRVINRELKGDFNLSYFDHLAFFNEEKSSIEMHLRANRDCRVRIESIGLEADFQQGETIHTERSRKFTKEHIEELATRAGLSVRGWYSDSKVWFSLVEMVSTS